MTDDQDFTPITTRLQAMGQAPVDRATQSHHLTMMATAGQPVASRGRSWARLVAAFSAGIVLGGAGLASAGVLPDPAQKVAHRAFNAVGVNVPAGTSVHGTVRYNDPAVCGTNEGVPWKNHGEYVSAHPDDPAASSSDCGKPLASMKAESGEKRSKEDKAEERAAKEQAKQDRKAASEDSTSTTDGTDADREKCQRPPMDRADKEKAAKEKAQWSEHCNNGHTESTTTTAPSATDDDDDADDVDDDAQQDSIERGSDAEKKREAERKREAEKAKKSPGDNGRGNGVSDDGQDD